MHSQLDLANTVLLDQKHHQRNVQSFDGEYVAKVFRYYRYLQNPYKSKTVPLKLISGKSLYNKHKDLFDSFAKLASSNNFDIEPYIKYCVNCGMTENTLDVCFSSIKMLDKYAIHLKKVNFRKKIYKWFIKSANNIASFCIENGFFTTKDFLRMMIETHQTGNYVISGEISLYFLAAIPNFKKIIPKLDYFSRQELQQLYSHFDIYHSDVNKAFLQEKNKYINPIDYTDKLIWDIREKRMKKKT